jgi:Condensation domain
LTIPVAGLQVLKMENANTQTEGLSASKRALLEKLKSGKYRPALETQSIRPRRIEDSLPLSFAQQRLWLVQQWNPASAAYNISGAIRLTGHLDVSALERSLTKIVSRHEALRTTFQVTGGQPVQVISPPAPVAFGVNDLRNTNIENPLEEAYRLASEDANRPFDLAKGPLFRATLLRLDTQDHVLLLSMHHTVFDGWSQQIFFEEMRECYEAFSKGDAPCLPSLPIQYADYAIWQRAQSEAREAQLGYWKRQLDGAPPILELPTDYPRPPKQTFRGDRQSLTLPADLAASLRALARQEGATMFMLLLAAFKALLYRYTGQTDIVIGTPVAGRNRVEIEKSIGVFINMLSLRNRVAGDLRFTQLLKQVFESTLEAYANQDVPFEQLVEELNPPRDLSRTPIFQIAFALQTAPDKAFELAGLGCSPLKIESGRARFDLTLFMAEKQQALTATLAYNIDLFKAETINRMLQHFSTILSSIVASPDARLDELDILTEAEALLLGKDTSVGLPDASFSF